MHLSLLVLESFFDKLKALLKDFFGADRVVGTLKKDQLLATFEGIVESLRVVGGNEGIILAVNEADLSSIEDCLKTTLHVHFLDVESCKGVHFALDAGEYTGEKTVKQTAAGLGQEF